MAQAAEPATQTAGAPVGQPEAGAGAAQDMPLTVVAIGASAGGLEPLEQLLRHAPAGAALAWVIVQHRPAAHPTMLPELLGRVSTLPVCDLQPGTTLRQGNVYVMPPEHGLELHDDKAVLSTVQAGARARLPIDAFFASLAGQMKERAVAIVLSGMGSDGALGVAEVHRQGGLVLVQEPETATFDSMPRSAMASGCVDAVAPAEELPARLLELLNARRQGRPATPAADPLQRVIDTLRERGRHDFSLYKRSTLRRRIDRRIAVHALPSMDAYANLLAGNAQETDLLFKELLIGVTSFFRDAPLWPRLRDEVIPALLARHAGEPKLRAWVAGCSTGEEAYSLAIIFREAVAANPLYAGATLQIFASDLNPEAIAQARRGRYPASIAADVSPERLHRYFVAQDGGYRVAPTIREMVLFDEHDLLLDPPFTRLDLLCCRNLLIYLSAKLQQRLLPLFHYSLAREGVLVLGTSETTARFESLFEPVDSKLRVYRRRAATQVVRTLEFPIKARQVVHSHARKEARMPIEGPADASVQGEADRLLLRDFGPAAVLVNADGDIIYVSGRTGRYLEPAAGKANWNLHAMAREGIGVALSAALRQVVRDGGTVELRDLQINTELGLRGVELSLRAIDGPGALAGMVLVVFRDSPNPPVQRRRRAGATQRALELELQRAREEVQTLREEMLASEEELRAANEELQSTNEELQSANEELNTSKEEMQSMNEELQTVNGELEVKLDDLAMAKSDLRNLLVSTDAATLFLDSALRVRRFNDQATQLINLREGDAGRPLTDLTSTLDYPQLLADVQDTLRTLAPHETQVRAADGRWFAVRIIPYRTIDNVIDGAVVSFVDVTAQRAALAQAASDREAPDA